MQSSSLCNGFTKGLWFCCPFFFVLCTFRTSKTKNSNETNGQIVDHCDEKLSHSVDRLRITRKKERVRARGASEREGEKKTTDGVVGAFGRDFFSFKHHNR